MSVKVNFTEAMLKSMDTPAPGKRIVLLDKRIEGLQCRVSHSGVKTFSVFRRVKAGRPERITIGRLSSELTLDKVRTIAIGINESLRLGKSAAELKRVQKKEMIFRELFEEYLEKYAKLNKRTWENDKANYRLYLEKPFGNKKITAISKTSIAQLHAEIPTQLRLTMKKSAAPKLKSKSTANRILALVSKIFNWAILMEYIDSNPAKGISKYSEVTRERFIDTDELPGFFEAVETEPNKAMGDFILFSLLTGARKTNVTSMRWDQISFDRKQWYIPQTKNGQSLIVPLVEEAMQILKDRKEYSQEYVFQPQATLEREAWLLCSVTGEDESVVSKMRWDEINFEQKLWTVKTLSGQIKTIPLTEEVMKILLQRKERGEEFVFPGEGKKGHLIEPRSAFKRILKNAKIKNLRIHDLRRTFGSWQAITGASGIIIGKSLGHRCPKATAVYTRLSIDPVRTSIEIATGAILKASKKKTEMRVEN